MQLQTITVYNTTDLYVALLTESSEVQLKCLSGANAVELESNFGQRTCSRSLHSNFLGRGSNPYSPHYRPTTLTNRPQPEMN